MAIIPARGGSKRMPRKNIKPFEGEPVIAHSIRAAIKSGCFDCVMVSTDDPEIADIALANGAEVPFMRSSVTSDDHSGLADVVLEVLSQLQNQGRVYDRFCCILATAPLIRAHRIKEGALMLDGPDIDAVVPVVRFGYPPQRGLSIADSGLALMVEPQNYNKRSQDLPAIYHDSGQFYWMFTAALRQHKRFFTERTRALPLSELEVQDIDTVQDWQLAELKYRLLKS